METEQLQTPEIEPRESIKLIKNTKGYNWEIKVLFEPSVPELSRIIDMKTIERIFKINNEMFQRFGDNKEGWTP